MSVTAPTRAMPMHGLHWTIKPSAVSTQPQSVLLPHQVAVVSEYQDVAAHHTPNMPARLKQLYQYNKLTSDENVKDNNQTSDFR